LRIAIGYQISLEYTYGIETKGLITVYGEFQPGLKGCYDYMTNCSTQKKKKTKSLRKTKLAFQAGLKFGFDWIFLFFLARARKMILPTLKKNWAGISSPDKRAAKSSCYRNENFCPG